MYKLFETEEYIKTLTKLKHQSPLQKVRSHVYLQLRLQPYFGKNIKKLKGYRPDTWRYRVGNFRLFYEINEDDKAVILLTIQIRKDAY